MGVCILHILHMCCRELYAWKCMCGISKQALSEFLTHTIELSYPNFLLHSANGFLL